MKEVMLDIETLGVEPGCVILSIGATDGKTDFNVHIDVEDSVKQGLIIEPRTTIWWMGQSDEARKLISQPGTPLLSALTLFSKAFDWKNSRVWCNGASFDFPILKAAFSLVGMSLPWPYYSEMDFRTVKNFVTKANFDKVRVKAEVAHDGLADAHAQLATLNKLIDHLNENYIYFERAA